MEGVRVGANSLRARSVPLLGWREAPVMAALLTIVGLYAWRMLGGALHPAEDAAMLMRYAQHLADGHGIVWNIGEAPLDGATDFAFMVLLAGLAKAGVALETAVIVVGLSAHALTVALVYVAARRLAGASIAVAALSAAYLAVGPGLGYVAAYFGTPFFALFAAIAWYFALTIALHGETRARAAGFAVSALLLGLIRPEGVFLAGLMLLAVLYRRGITTTRGTVGYFFATFLVLGGAYFLWRWQYFAQPLPNPFYKKGGGTLHWDSLVASARNAVILCLPVAPAFVAALRSRASLQQAVFILIPTGGFVALWVLMSNEMNFLMRFQYAILPLVLMAWPLLVQGLGQDFRLPRLRALPPREKATASLLLVVLALGVLAYQYKNFPPLPRGADGRQEVARALAAYQQHGYTMAVTEAGLLPFYSGWRAIDTWGLNDRRIAHQGPITPAYLDEQRPHIIMFHAYYSPLTGPGEATDAWNTMVATLDRYAQQNNYILAAVFGLDPGNTHYYYVRSDFAHSAVVVAAIRGALPYAWNGTGKPSLNYAPLPARAEAAEVAR